MQLASVQNFRDVGGLVGQAGRLVRRGMVYRSGQFDVLSVDELAEIRAWRFQMRCDLRSEHERAVAPGVWPDAGTPDGVIVLDLGADPRAANVAFRDVMAQHPTALGAELAMQQFQRHMAERCGPAMRRLFDAIIEKRRVPAVIHCRYGKDRTGLVVALLLLALGVDRDAVMDDYLRSNDHIDVTANLAPMRRMIEPIIGRPPEEDMVRKVILVQRDYLDAAFVAIERRHGSIPAFLEHEPGLSPVRLEGLRSLLLEAGTG